MLLGLLISGIILAIIAAVIALMLIFAIFAAVVTVGGWVLATLVGIKIAGVWEKKEEYLLASIGTLLAIVMVALVIVW